MDTDTNYLGINEIAELAKVSPSAVINWRKRDKHFPSPIVELKSGPVFDFYQIKKYLKKRSVPMANVIATINLKGGVGKTTTTIALAEFLSGEFGKRVLVIDLDPQTNASTLLIGEDSWKELNKREFTLARLFKDALDPDNPKFDLNKTLQKEVSDVDSVKTLDLLPSSLDLIDIQDRIANVPSGRFYAQNPIDILRRAIKPVMEQYEYIIIDCPPNLGIITLNGLNIADGYIIPTIPDTLSTYGIPQIVTRVKEFANSISEDIKAYGIIVTKYRAQSTVHNNILKILRREKDAPLFETIIPETNQIAAAAEFTPHATLKQKWGYQGQFNLYKSLCEEIIEKVEYELQS